MSASNSDFMRLVHARLTRTTPQIAPPASVLCAHASVALVFRETEHGPELLFIERALREGDHWSGDMAFPGGRRDEIDADAEATARRETFEELGIVLAEPLGRLDDFDSRIYRRNFEIVVSPFVFAHLGDSRLVLSHEVASAHWIRFHELVAPISRTTLERRFGAGIQRLPALAFGERRIWGMTYHMLKGFAELVDIALP